MFFLIICLVFWALEHSGEQDYSLCGVHNTKNLLEQSQMSDMLSCLLQERILLINCPKDTGPAAPQHPLELG